MSNSFLTVCSFLRRKSISYHVLFALPFLTPGMKLLFYKKSWDPYTVLKLFEKAP